MLKCIINRKENKMYVDLEKGGKDIKLHSAIDMIKKGNNNETSD